ncbi:IPT/TIG domain-containing protein [Candidiatus Paracoxiella cheracis]|uniref:IPT/TIG domain-containing protein n=1 Tax=Candidiatus Paracoxiella cheracis TaxID=3405120 RepID=UPI003BF54DFC
MHTLGGSIELRVQYSYLFKDVYAINFNQLLGLQNAVSLKIEYGGDENRLNATWGAALSKHQLFKVTVERLTQNLPFYFDSGQINKNVSQNAYGVSYEIYRLNNVLQNIELGAYYADADSINLSPVYFFSNGSEFINYRHIAGGQSIGGEIGSFININERLQLHLGLTYDHVKYNQHYVLVRTQQESAQLRGYIGMNILLSQTVELELFGSQRAIYDDYFAKLKWLLPVSTKHPIELVGSIEHVVSHNDIPNNTIYLLTLNFSWGVREGYRLASEGAPNVLNWVKSPAVYMQQVLAAVDQKTVRITSTPNPITVSPNIGSTAGGTDVTITGSGFTGATEVTFDGVAATNCTVVNDTTITCTTPPHAVGSVNVAVTGPGGTGTLTNGFTYENLPVPSPTTVNPNTGTTAGGTAVTITGTGFTGATGATFDGVAATDFTVVNDTTITCTTPAHAAGSVNVAVTGPGGSGTVTNVFTYENPTPNPTTVNPNTGTTAGGTAVTITGTGFTLDFG